jgi:hypothetical protein
MGFKRGHDADMGGRIATFEEKANQDDGTIVVLQGRFQQLSTDFRVM